MSLLIGMTYDLMSDYIAEGFSEEQAAEFDAPETIDAIHGALEANGYRVERIGGIKPLVKSLAAGKRWDLVFNICEGVNGIGREAQVPALLEAYDIPCVFSASEVMVTTMDKRLTKLIVREAGVPTPEFAIVGNEEDIAWVLLPFPLFVKPLAEGTSKGVTGDSIVHDRKGLEKTCRRILEEFGQPAIVETYLPGREFTVGIVGTGDKARSVGVLEIVMNEDAEAGCYSYYNKVACKETFLKGTGLEAEAAEDVALKAWRALGCKDGGRVDVRMDGNGVMQFMEAGALAGLRPGYSELTILAEMNGTTYEQLIGEMVESALSRCSGHIKEVRVKAA